MRDADIGCSLGASDALTTARLQGDPAAAALLLQLQEYIHSLGFNLLLVIQLLTIIGLVALAIWVRENIANIRNKDMDAEHPTTCFELLRQGRVVIAGLESEVARLQVQVRDLNDNLKLKQQDGGHRTTRREELLRRQKPAKAEPQAPHTSSAAAPAPRRGDTQSLQRDFDCLHLAAEVGAHEGNLPAAVALFQATARSSSASNNTVEAGTSTEHAFEKSKSSESFENMVATFGTPPHLPPMAAPSSTPYVDQARAPQSRTTRTSQRTEANGAAPAGASLGRTDASGAAPAGATQTFREMMVKRMMSTPDAPPTPMNFKRFARVH